MKFTVTDDFGAANMTSLRGYVRSDYTTLVDIFGEPQRGGDKTTVEWVIEFEDEEGDFVVATIYDWKEYDTPMGEYDWHIGGHNYRAVDFVQQVINEYNKVGA